MSLTIDQDIHSLAAQAGVRLRAYDHPSSIDRYTVVFDDGAARLTYIGMNASPFHPQGFGQHGELERRNLGSHLGKRINISDLLGRASLTPNFAPLSFNFCVTAPIWCPKPPLPP